MVLTSPRSIIRMMDVIAVACQEFGLTVSEKKIEAMHLWSDSNNDGTLGCRLRSGCSTLGGRGSYAVLICHVDYVLTGL